MSIPEFLYLLPAVKQNFQGQLVVLWQGNVLPLMNIALELWTTLNSSKKYYGKKVFASEEKKANITVLPDHMVFLTSWKRCNSKYRRKSHPPRLNNERRQFNLAPLNPMSPLPQSKKTTTPNPPPKNKKHL